jgi:hypothetical protein
MRQPRNPKLLQGRSRHRTRSEKGHAYHSEQRCGTCECTETLIPGVQVIARNRDEYGVQAYTDARLVEFDYLLYTLCLQDSLSRPSSHLPASSVCNLVLGFCDRHFLAEVQLSNAPNQIRVATTSVLSTDLVLGVNQLLLCPVFMNEPSSALVVDKCCPTTVHARSP